MDSDPDNTSAERRKNLLLRTLIDEMMGQIRELQQHAGPWPTEERARLEADLDRIMAQVRSQAFTKKPR
jgi:hypothetical protein